MRPQFNRQCTQWLANAIAFAQRPLTMRGDRDRAISSSTGLPLSVDAEPGTFGRRNYIRPHRSCSMLRAEQDCQRAVYCTALQLGRLREVRQILT